MFLQNYMAFLKMLMECQQKSNSLGFIQEINSNDQMLVQ